MRYLPFGWGLVLALLWLIGPGAAAAAEPNPWVAENLGELVELYQQFHRQPELSLAEHATAERLAKELRSAGLQVTTGVGGTGVVGVLENGPGPTLLLRADLDGLPVTEQTGLVYASTLKADDGEGGTTGVMHACGHDIHMTTLVGTARYLAAHKDRFSGTVVCIGQPAEERGLGAKAMLNDGLFTRFPKPDFGLALHVDAVLATGKVGYRAGYILANTDSVDIVVKGKGGHGAYPHTTIDPIVQAAKLILDLQTIASRETKPLEPVVVTVGSIHGGSKHNIIGDRCELQLTVRTYNADVREQVLASIKRKARAAAASMEAPEPEIVVSEGTPALMNDEQLVARLKPVFERVLEARNVVLAERSMGGEDFSQYGLAGVPIFMYRLGSVSADRLEGYARVDQSPPSLHSPLYYPDAEQTLATGVTTMAAAVLELLPIQAK